MEKVCVCVWGGFIRACVNERTVVQEVASSGSLPSVAIIALPWSKFASAKSIRTGEAKRKPTGSVDEGRTEQEKEGETAGRVCFSAVPPGPLLNWPLYARVIILISFCCPLIWIRKHFFTRRLGDAACVVIPCVCFAPG